MHNYAALYMPYAVNMPTTPFFSLQPPEQLQTSANEWFAVLCCLGTGQRCCSKRQAPVGPAMLLGHSVGLVRLMQAAFVNVIGAFM